MGSHHLHGLLPFGSPVGKIVPLIQNHLHIGISVLVEHGLDAVVLCDELVRSRCIEVI